VHANGLSKMEEIVLDRISSFLDTSSVSNQKSQTKAINEEILTRENEYLYLKKQKKDQKIDHGSYNSFYIL
jgi:hypothetical protein